MTKLRNWIIAIIAAGMIVGAQSAQAHCDSIDGPVAKAVQKALETGNINPVLAYAPASAEVEIRAAFMKSRKVRGLGADVRVCVLYCSAGRAGSQSSLGYGSGHRCNEDSGTDHPYCLVAPCATRLRISSRVSDVPATRLPGSSFSTPWPRPCGT